MVMLIASISDEKFAPIVASGISREVSSLHKMHMFLMVKRTGIKVFDIL